MRIFSRGSQTLFCFSIALSLVFILVLLAGCASPKPNETADKTAVDVPEWSKGAVWYEIFPERFRNGDTSNDPDFSSLNGSYPQDLSSDWQVSNWTSDWYVLQPWEKRNGHDYFYNVDSRRYGGDLQGIIDKLGYMQELGVGAIYLTPIFQSPSSHKYDSSAYHHVDVNFGPDPKGDLELMNSEDPSDPSTWKVTKADQLAFKLIREAHKRNIKVVFDGVFNHVGIRNFAFQDVVKNRQKSKYADWFTVFDWNKTNSIGILLDYSGWAGIPYLPEWRKDSSGINPGAKSYIFASVKKWMDPNGDGNPEDGIDGWRLDVAFDVPHNFWKEFRNFTKSINPNAYLVAEIWRNPDQLPPYLQGDEFDALMNYNFAYFTYDYVVDQKTRVNTSEFSRSLLFLNGALPANSSLAMMNLVDSHDTQRIQSALANPDLGRFRESTLYFISKDFNPFYSIRGPTDGELRKLKMVVALQMAYPGAPMIYYGDEAGMWGANDPACRKPMIWQEFNYSSESHYPDQRERTPDKVAFMADLFDYYKKLIQFRKEHKALSTGSYEPFAADDASSTFGFARKQGNDTVVLLLRNSETSGKYLVPAGIFQNGEIEDLLSGRTYSSQNGVYSVELENYSAAILYLGK